MRDLKFQSVDDAPIEIAPDGSEVRPLLAAERGSISRVWLAANAVSTAVRHRSVEELWYVVEGRGRFWRERDGVEENVDLYPGVCLNIPKGTRFQFRSGDEGLAAVITTMPPWPGDHEAQMVVGRWTPTVGAARG